MIVILVVTGLCLVVAASWLTVAYWVRSHGMNPGSKRPELTVIQGGRRQAS